MNILLYMATKKMSATNVNMLFQLCAVLLLLVVVVLSLLINMRNLAVLSHIFQLTGPLIEQLPVQINWVIPLCQRHREGLPEDTYTQLHCQLHFIKVHLHLLPDA